MINKLTRLEFSDNGIFGQFSFEGDSQSYCVTLEHSFNDAPIVPTGIYTCKRGVHCLEHGKPFETFEILGVSGHSGILFHVGNFNDDSRGCVLLGETRTGDIITQSVKTFEGFMSRLLGVDTFQLEVINHGH